MVKREKILPAGTEVLLLGLGLVGVIVSYDVVDEYVVDVNGKHSSIDESKLFPLDPALKSEWVRMPAKGNSILCPVTILSEALND